MPNNLVDKVCIVCGLQKEKVEELWTKAEDIVRKRYAKIDKSNPGFFQLVVGVFKNSIGKDCTNKLGWTKKPILEDIELLIEGTIYAK